VFLWLLAATLGIHLIGWWLRQPSALSRVLLLLGLIVVGLMAWQFQNIRKDAADARLETAALKERISGRKLLPEQLKALTAMLSKFPGKVVHVSSSMQDIEADSLAQQISSAASNAKLQIDDKRMWVSTTHSVIVGMRVTGTEIPLVDAATALLTSFGLTPISNQPVEDNYMNVEEEDAPFPLKIFVGAKPPTK
jgi:hypothetical protein